MRTLHVVRIAVIGLALGLPLTASWAAPGTARGLVYEDRNANQRFDDSDAPIPGVLVSNGVEVVAADKDGRYELPVTNDTILFVIKPRGYRTVVDEIQIPRFYYIHKPKGSPKFRVPGVAPTGILPDSVDFPLYPQKEPDTFRAVVFADTQVRDRREIDYLEHDIVEELIGVDADFGVTLGDIVFNDITLFDDLNNAVGQIGIPWHNVIGNHDSNQRADEDRFSDETFERIYGPHVYAFDYGPVHFIAMDTVFWGMKRGEQERGYRAGIDNEQLAFIGNYLNAVPKNELVVLMMHIPINQVPAAEREALFALLADRPRTLSIAGHTHYQQQVFMDKAKGWKGSQPHHLAVLGTACGSWWGGPLDELGIPQTSMRDGTPNGYSILTFNGADYSIEYKAARRPADFQMTIHAPDDVATSATRQTEVVVNVFTGSEKSTVEMKVGDDAAWIPMTQFSGKDPVYVAAKEMEGPEKPKVGHILPDAMVTVHLWKANLPGDVKPGTYTIRVRHVDMFGKTYEARRVIGVR